MMMIQNAWKQLAMILSLSLIGALILRVVDPIAKAEVSCDPSTIAADEICLRTVIDEWKSDCVWIDARRRVDWQKDGLAGSLLLTTAEGENFELLLEQAFPILAQKNQRVVVYCSDAGCGTSREIAKRLREYQLVPDVKALHGGWKALSQAGLIPRKP
ncbi:MAG: rhodanese-like domain-containing protein [Akkermansiaceae bacterium]